MNDNFIEYIAGLFDADGYVSLVLNNRKNECGNILMSVGIVASDSVDHNHLALHKIKSITGVGNITFRKSNSNTDHLIGEWKVTKNSELKYLVPKLIDSCIIKSSHLQRIFSLYKSIVGKKISSSDMDHIREFSNDSRLNAGSLKYIDTPSYPWISGYLDGDGYFVNNEFKQKIKNVIYNGRQLYVGVECHINDRCGIDLLNKSFGGIVKIRKTAPHLIIWQRNLGSREPDFACNFLSNILPFSLIKQDKIKNIINFHNLKYIDIK